MNSRPASPVVRLSGPDLINLAAETDDTPMHVGVLAVLDGASLLDADGRLRLADLRAEIHGRLSAVPRLTQILRPAWPLAGHPLWTECRRLQIEQHVTEVTLPGTATSTTSPDADGALLTLTAKLLETRLDRSRPLWRMWFVTGLPQHRVGLVIVVHHVVADGFATIRMLSTLLDRTHHPAVPPRPPEPAPSRPALVRDDLRSRPAASRIHARRASGSRVDMRGLLRGLVDAWHAPRTSLNAPVGPHRRLAVARFDLATARHVAHAHHSTINDLVLDLAAGGLRELLSRRGESVTGLSLHAAVAVSLRAPDDTDSTGNLTGTMIVRLPVDEPDPAERLRLIAAETSRTKRTQSAAGGTALLVWLSRLRLLRTIGRHQHMTNVHESNVIGPPAPIHILGAPVLDLVPVSVLSGNVGLAFLAFSYAGRLSITVLADADRHPDLSIVTAAVERDWQTLIR